MIRRLTALGIAAEALLLAGYGLFLLGADLFTSAQDRVGAAVLGVIALFLGVGLALAGRGVARGHRAARAPVLTWQVLQVAVGAPALRSRWWLGLILVALGIAVAAGVLTRGVVGDPEEPADDPDIEASPSGPGAPDAGR